MDAAAGEGERRGEKRPAGEWRRRRAFRESEREEIERDGVAAEAAKRRTIARASAEQKPQSAELAKLGGLVG